MEEPKRSIWPSLVLALGITGLYAWMNQPSATPDGAESTQAGAPADAAGSAAELAEAQRAARARAETRVTITTAEYVATFTDRNAALVSFVLRDPRFDHREGRTRTKEDLVSTDREELLPMRQTLRGIRMPVDATYRAEQVDAQTVRFTYEGDGFRVARTVKAGQFPYTLSSDTKITSTSAGPRPVRAVEHVYRYVARQDEGGSSFLGSRSPAITQGLCKTGRSEVRELREALVDARGIGPGVHFGGWGNNYFTMAVAPRDGTVERCVAAAVDRGEIDGEPAGSTFEIDLLHPRKVVPPGGEVRFRSVVYAGPKDPDRLEAAGHSFISSMDLGFFGWIARKMAQLLGIIHRVVPNWGIAIVLLTVLVRTLLYPLTAASFKSMAKMRVLKPELDRIQELYGDDQEKKGAAMMALYKKHEINPFAGCLPALGQMPIWLALYTSLSTNLELYHAPFLVWTDLSAPDPFHAMPLALAALMYVQQKMTPNTMDPVQAKMMLYMMPAMMGLFMLFLPAGLCVYMLTNSTLGILQQRYVQWRLDRVPTVSADGTIEAEVVEAPKGASEPGKKGSNRGRS